MTPFEARSKHPELYEYAEEIARSKDKTMLSIRNGISIPEIAVKNGVIMSLYKRFNYRKDRYFLQQVSEVLNTTPEYISNVIDLNTKEDHRVKTTNWGAA